MTDAEKDREAVGWMETEIRWADMNDLEEHAENCRRILALAREALAMRERGPKSYAVETQWGQGSPWVIAVVRSDRADAADLAKDWKSRGWRVRILPLYAGEPVEESDA